MELKFLYRETYWKSWEPVAMKPIPSTSVQQPASLLQQQAAKVAKHGNRSVSSKSGAADCLEALGVKLDLEPEQNAKVLEESNICFMFAQKYHSAMRFVGTCP